ncbi:acetolactate decarboxylase [Chitinophagaceae bacterium LB-8]|uniref:Alpha-acetolactate decarboxylase n=1 Tax=Paraflavisolibacter caeni TaxID=2982496 RepID=A0A9X2XSC1_9BACT|nr:acetolactate decarboxylase [Paraflavisolibacter caeni]MCU7548149.1 acetolactate decarboxylase [Paraflavisolibacter caeni]
MKMTICKFLLVGSAVVVAGFVSRRANLPHPSNHLYQYSVISALQKGFFASDGINCGQLKQHGNFGIGTFNDVDGEMIVLNDTVYQATASGQVVPVADSLHTPFATVTFFKADTAFTLSNAGQPAIYQLLQRHMEHNQVYAIRLTGTFDSMRVRSVPKQKQPYPTLVEVAQKQTEFQWTDIAGTMVGFFSPEYLSAVSVPGFHFHFLDHKRTRGGHMLNFRTATVTVELGRMQSFQIGFPHSADFNKLQLTGIDKQDIYKAEH